MLDIKVIRENPELVRQSLENRHDTAPVDEILQIDSERRKKVGELDGLRQQRKTLSKEREKAQEKGRALRAEIQEMEAPRGRFLCNVSSLRLGHHIAARQANQQIRR